MAVSALLDAAVEVYAIAKFYASEGDDELLRRVTRRIEREGLTLEQVEQRLHDRVRALIEEHRA